MKAAGDIYYVSTVGNDANVGSEVAPWRTLGKAAESAGPGDTVYILQGTYREKLKPRNAGVVGSPIVFTAYPGHLVVLDGEEFSRTSWGGIIELVNVQYVTISNLRIINSGYFGVMITGVEHVLVQNNEIDFTYASGIYVSRSQHVVVDGNDVQRACHGIGGSAPHYAPQEHITVRGGTDTFEIKNNVVSNPHNGRGKEGINVKEGAANGKVYNNRVFDMSRTGLYVDAYDKYVTNVEIYGNVVYNSLHGLVIASERRGTVSNIAVYNNVFYKNEHSGIWLTGYLDGGPFEDILVYNNTVYGNANRGIAVTNREATGVTVRNNIAVGNANQQIQIDSGVPAVTVEHNLTDGDAGFVDPGRDDFRLRSDSPAIDKADSAGAPAFDVLGFARPQGAGYDQGAFEFNSDGAAIPTESPTDTPTAMPIETPTATPTATPTVASPTPTPVPALTITPPVPNIPPEKLPYSVFLPLVGEQ
ncbi:DUF1565 domain-containing protein [bacterium]|nr:DUF1565 domain-containing protein [bacterium]